MNPSEGWWTPWRGSDLSQGDLILDCPIPMVVRNPDGKSQVEQSQSLDVEFELFNCVVITQSCDLANAKSPTVALCPIYTLDEFAQFIPRYRNAKNWESVRKGQVEGLHLLASPTNPADNLSALVVAFRSIYSLPHEVVAERAEAMGDRWRLNSPYLEHLSQSFARFFMRVGLPAGIPAYKS